MATRTKPRKRETRARRSPEIVKDLVTGEPVRLRSISARKRDYRVRIFKRRLLLAAPNLADDKFLPITVSFSRISVLSMDAYRFLHQRGIIGADGELRKSVDTYSKLLNTQLKLAEKLGLTPSAFKAVATGQPFDLVAEIAKTRTAHTRADPEDAQVVKVDGDQKAADDQPD
jgi:hypothetical protein